MEGWAARFAELFDITGVDYQPSGFTVWVEFNRMVVPVGPLRRDYSMPRDAARELLRRFPRAMMVRYTAGFDTDGGSGWYAVLRSSYADVEAIASRKSKAMVARGLRECEVRRLDADYVAGHGYQVYAAAHQRYKGVKAPELSAAAYRAEVLATRSFGDIVEYWGVFRHGDLAGLATVYVFGREEASVFDLKLDPAFMEHRPAFAIHHEQARDYLGEQGYGCINYGLRNLLHQTDIQDFLVRHFSCERVPLKLRLVMRPGVAAAVKLSYPARAALGRLHPKLNAFYQLYQSAGGRA